MVPGPVPQRDEPARLDSPPFRPKIPLRLKRPVQAPYNPVREPVNVNANMTVDRGAP